MVIKTLKIDLTKSAFGSTDFGSVSIFQNNQAKFIYENLAVYFLSRFQISNLKVELIKKFFVKEVLNYENFRYLRRFVGSYKLDLLTFNIKKYDDLIIKKALVKLIFERMIEITKLIVNNMQITDTYKENFGLIRDVYEKNDLKLLAEHTLICASQTNRLDIVRYLIEDLIGANSKIEVVKFLMEKYHKGNFIVVKGTFKENF